MINNYLSSVSEHFPPQFPPPPLFNSPLSLPVPPFHLPLIYFQTHALPFFLSRTISYKIIFSRYGTSTQIYKGKFFFFFFLTSPLKKHKYKELLVHGNDFQPFSTFFRYLELAYMGFLAAARLLCNKHRFLF